MLLVSSFNKEGTLLAVSCPRCGEEDSFGHLLECAGLEIPLTEDAGQLVEFLGHMAVKTAGGNPGLPTPILPIQETEEIELAWSVSTNDEISF